MLRPRGLGRRVAQGPHSFPAFSDNSRQKTHQTKSVTFRFPCHCDLFSPVATHSGALSDNSRQNQAESGNFRQNQAISGKIRPFSGIFRQNQAESGKIGQPIGSGKSLVRDLCCSKNHKLLPLFGQSFFGCIPSKLKPKETTIKLQAMASFLPRHGNCADKSWTLPQFTESHKDVCLCSQALWSQCLFACCFIAWPPCGGRKQSLRNSTVAHRSTNTEISGMGATQTNKNWTLSSLGNSTKVGGKIQAIPWPGIAWFCLKGHDFTWNRMISHDG